MVDIYTFFLCIIQNYSIKKCHEINSYIETKKHFCKNKLISYIILKNNVINRCCWNILTVNEKQLYPQVNRALDNLVLQLNKYLRWSANIFTDRWFFYLCRSLRSADLPELFRALYYSWYSRGFNFANLQYKIYNSKIIMGRQFFLMLLIIVG